MIRTRPRTSKGYARRPTGKWTYWLLGGLALLLTLSALNVLFLRSRVPETRNPMPEAPRFDRFFFRNMSYTAHEEDRRILTLTAEEVIHRKKRIGPLTINPVKEIAMSGVTLEIYGTATAPTHEEGASFSVPVRQILEKLAPSEGLGFVSQVTVDRMEIIFLMDDAVDFTLSAGTARLGRRPQVIFEDGFSLESGAGERLTSDRAEWRNDSRLLWIGGDYVFRGAEGRREKGVGALFALGEGGRIDRRQAAPGPRDPAPSVGTESPRDTGG